MNRRDFLTVLGGASVASLAGIQPAFAAEQTTDLYLSGLIMVSFDDPVLRIGFPKAAGHRGILQIVPIKGKPRTIPVKGNGTLESKAIAGGRPKISVPELVQMSEFYGPDVKASLNHCVSVIEIPYSAIKSITTNKLTKDRFTFIRTDNGKEVETFRPRQVAEGLKLELSSNSVLKLDGGKVSIPLATTFELRGEFAPEPKDRVPNMIEDHFVHYFPNIERPPAADFLVAPKKITGAMASMTPRAGNHFMMFDGMPLCWLVAIGMIG